MGDITSIPTLWVVFIPQVWVRDQAWDAPPLGDQVWQVSPAGFAALSSYKDYDDALAYERWFEHDDNAPEWVKEWDGPFYIYEQDAQQA